MLTEEFIVIDPTSPLWNAARPLLEAALRLEQGDEEIRWHGWQKRYIDSFLKGLPDHCTLLVGVWDSGGDEETPERETLVTGFICEVRTGVIHTLRTLEALTGEDLPPINELEPGYQHAFELMRVTRTIAPVAWALFTDRATWNEWVYEENGLGTTLDKGTMLSELARQGRCVLLGSQATHSH